MAKSVVVDRGGQRRAVGHEPLRQPGGEGEAPDRVEVGAGGPEQLQAIALRLGQRALVGHDVAVAVLSSVSAPITPVVCWGRPSSPVNCMR